MGNEGLQVHELLERTCQALSGRHQGGELKLEPHGASSEVANDSDHHRSRIGDMFYNDVFIVVIGDRTWVIGCGRPRGYPADPYAGDILAIDVSGSNRGDEGFIKELRRRIERETYFRNTLIIGVYSGNLAASDRSRFGRKVLEGIGTRLQYCIAQKAQQNHEFLYLNLAPVMDKTTRYKLEAVDLLVEVITKVLEEMS